MNRCFAAPLSLAALAGLAGCMSLPKALDLAPTRPNIDSRYLVTLQPPARPAAINQLHAWRVLLSTPAGTPVAHARIQVDGGVPQGGAGR